MEDRGQAHTKSDGTFKIKDRATHTGRYRFWRLFGSSGYIGSKSCEGQGAGAP